MTRIRRSDGTVVDVGPGEAVEVTDAEGRVAVAVYTERGGTTRILLPGDELYTAYCKSNGVKPAKVTVHEEFEGQSMRG